eukprot:6486585-Amphidinium_carterae.1
MRRAKRKVLKPLAKKISFLFLPRTCVEPKILFGFRRRVWGGGLGFSAIPSLFLAGGYGLRANGTFTAATMFAEEMG